MALSTELDYRVRPAKAIERKMLVEAAGRLGHFANTEAYQYVGMGAVHFRDFVLMHRGLGIERMTSIEGSLAKESRVRFNRPYATVEIEIGHSNTVLPKLNWETRAIIWLDYTDTLTSNVADDVAMVSARAPSGSLLIVTVNAAPSAAAVGRLNAYFGESRVGFGKDQVPLARPFAAAEARLIKEEVGETLRERNRILADDERFDFAPLFNFRYRDGAHMVTTGGVLFSEPERDKVRTCGFERLPYYRPESEAYEIRVPTLTFRELQHLDQHMPTSEPSVIESLSATTGLPATTIEQYAELYRYYPTFAEADL